MKQEIKPNLRLSKREEVANMTDVLAEMQRSGSIHFLKSLPKSAVPTRKNKQRAQLLLPAQFVRENGDKIEEWVTLRTQSSCGRSSRPWVVRLSVFESSHEGAHCQVQFAGGWKDFVTGNRLKEGDFLLFHLNEGARSEFEGHVFRGREGSPYLPDVGDSSSNEEEEERSASDSKNNNKQSHVPSPMPHRDEHKKAFTRSSSESKATPLQHPKHSENGRAFPGFHKRLTVASIPRSDHCQRKTSGRFEFPWSFVKTHDVKIQAWVNLQGVYEDSPTYIIPIFRFKRKYENIFRICFKSAKWSRFVKENGLEEGQELQFSFTADSNFVARKV